jgi:DUF2911 family protein
MVVAALSVALTAVFSQPMSAQGHVDMTCIARTDMAPLEERASPLDSVTFMVAGSEVKVCYGRPSAKGRTMIGTGSEDGPIQMGEVPFGKVWRTGANEPTILMTPVALTLAGISVPAGTYSIYTVPGPTEWEIIVNRSYSQWGMESFYTAEVEADEVGRGKVASEQVGDHVETFTIRPVASPEGGVLLVLEWEHTRVPLRVGAGR